MATTEQRGVGSYGCVFPTGHAGYNCEQDMDEGSASPCMNGGTCRHSSTMTLLADRYVCTYAPGGYAGIICETHTDERASSPCLLARTRACTYGYKDIPIGTRFEQSSTSACPTRAATWVRALATPCEQLCVCTWLERLQL